MKFKTVVLLAASFVALFIMLIGVNKSALAQVRPTNEIVQGYIKDYLRSQGKSKYPMQVIGMGSWISNTNYRDPLNLEPGRIPSDHDLRLVVPDDMPADQAIRKWKEFQQFMRKKIASNFPANQVNNVLNSVTIYPPEQLIANLDSNSQVMDYFQNVLNGKPNLGTESIEGYFGTHNQPFRQNYERTKGRLFYLDGKNVVKTTTDLQHAAEGGLKSFTTANQARGAQDAIDHALDLAKKNDIDGTIKQMSRVDQAIKKAKDLKRIPHNSNIDDVIKKLKDLPPGDIPSDLLEQINQVLKNADTEAKLLQNLDYFMNRNALKESQLIVEMLTSSSSGMKSSMRSKLWELASNIPADKFLKVIEVGLVSYDVYDAVQSASEEEYDKAYRSALLGALGTSEVGLLPLAPAIIADIFLDYVKSKGYTMIAAMQDCEFLMDGICNAAGRAQETTNKKMKNYSPETVFDNNQPINTNEYISLVQSHLQIMAHNCTVRGDNTRDRKSEQALFDRCLAQLVKEWNEYRIKKMGEVSKLELDFLKKIDNTTLGLNAKPNPTMLSKQEKGKKSEATVNLKAHYYYDKDSITSLHNKMSNIFNKFGGPKHLTYIQITTKYIWKVDGQEISNNYSYYNGGNSNFFNEEEAVKDIKFDKPGNYKVDFDFIVEINFVAQNEVEMVDEFINKLYMNQTIIKSASTTVTIEDIDDDNKNGSEEQPDDKTEQPDDKTQQPDDKTQQPDDKTQQPDDKTQQPDDKTQQPDDKTQQPDDKTQQPDDETKQPDDKTQQPDDKTNKQDNNKTTSNSSNSKDEILKKLLQDKEKLLIETKALAKKFSERTKKSEQMEKDLLKEWDKWNDLGYSSSSKSQSSLSKEELKKRYPKVYEAREKAKLFNKCLKTFRGGDSHEEQRSKDYSNVTQVLSRLSMNDKDFTRVFPNLTGQYSMEIYLQKKKAEISDIKQRPYIYEIDFPAGCVPSDVTSIDTSKNDQPAEDQSTKKTEKDIKCTITGLSPKVYFGSTKSISVKITSDSKGSISSVLWDSSPNLTFNPRESSGVSSNVTFDRMQNPTRIWADVSIGAEDVADLRLGGEIGELENYSAKGASKVQIEPQEVEVISPEFSFQYEPSANDLKIGQPITVTIIAKPAVADSLIDYRWIEPTDRKELANGKIEIIPKDNKPIKLHVMARVPGVGDSINDDITDTITASDVKVTANVKGPKFDRTFKVWNKNKGMVEESKEYAIDQQILLEAEVEGVDKSKINYKWSVNPECSIAAGSNSKELTISRHEVGNCSAKVVVSNKQGNKLGEDTASVDITISQEDLDMAQKAQQTNQAKEKFNEAKKLYQAGKIDEAIKTAEEASALDPKNADIKTFIATVKTEKTRYMGVTNEAKTLIDKDDLLSAQSKLDPIPSNFKLYQPIKEVIDLLNKKKEDKKSQEDLAKQKLTESKIDYNSGNIDQSLEKAENAVNVDPKNAEAKSFLNKVKMEKEKYLNLANEAKILIANGDLDAALNKLAGIPSNFQQYPPIKEVFDLLKQKKEDQAKLRTKLNGDLSKAIGIAGECKYAESLSLLDTIIEQDPYKNTPKAFSEAKHFRQQFSQTEATLKDLMTKAKNAIANNDFKTYNQNISSATSINKNCPEIAEIKALAEKQKKKQALSNQQTQESMKQGAEKQFEQGQSEMKNGNYTKAASSFRQAMNIEPNNTKYLKAYGICSMLSGDKGNALGAFNRIIQLDPSKRAEMEKLINTINSPNFEATRQESLKQLAKQNNNTNQNTQQTSNIVPIAPTPSNTGNNIVPIAPTPSNVVPLYPTPNSYTSPSNIAVNQGYQYQPPYNQTQQKQTPGNLSNEFNSVLNQVKSNQTSYNQGRSYTHSPNYQPPVHTSQGANTSFNTGTSTTIDRLNNISQQTQHTQQTSNNPCNTSQNTSNTTPASIVGDWYFYQCDKYSANLEIRGSGGNLTGRINFHILGQWEPITNIQYNSSTGQIRFFRPKYPQTHTGKVVGINMSGTLNRDDKNPGSGMCNWTAKRTSGGNSSGAVQTTHAPGSQSNSSSNIAGRWNLNANGYSGILEISGGSGKIYFNTSKQWETLADVSYNSSTGRISFHRPWAGNPNFQHYWGQVSGNRITGNFKDNHSPNKNYQWYASK